MKATLVIKNIEKLYTCDARHTVLRHAYIAIHHEWIMSVGIGECRGLMDAATRVLDASGEIAVPGFIEACYVMPEKATWNETIRHEHDTLWRLQKSGILTVMTRDGRVQQRTLLSDAFRSRPHDLPQVVYGQKEKPEGPFVLSCQGPGKTFSFQPAAFYLRHMLGMSSQDILDSMTCWPAMAQRLKDRGVIEKGRLADILVFRVRSIDELFDQADLDSLRRIVKNGIPVWPEMIRC